MLLLVGLGNPGRDYARSRHNIGFMALDEIADRYGFSAFRRRFHGLVAEGHIADKKVLALKPTTYMNESGRSVAEAVRFYKLPVEDVLVIHDEIDLVAGKVRVKRGGGSAGHRGIKSLDAHLDAPDYRRVRLGVGHPGQRGRVNKHVLGDFSKTDREGWVSEELAAIADAMPDLVRGDDAGFMNRLALALRPTDEPAKDKRTAPNRPAPRSRRAAPEAPTPAKISALGAALAAAIGRRRKRD